MEQFLEIIASILGLIIYWVLTSRVLLKKEESPTAPPAEPLRPERPKMSANVVASKMPAAVKIPKFDEPMELQIEEEEEAPPPRRRSEVVIPTPIERKAPQPKNNSFDQLYEEYINPSVEQIEKMIPGAPAQNTGMAFDRDDQFDSLLKGKEAIKTSGKTYTGKYANVEIEDIPMPKITIPTLKYGKKGVPKAYSRYRKMLNNPQAAKDAFILKEIFDTKYF